MKTLAGFEGRWYNSKYNGGLVRSCKVILNNVSEHLSKRLSYGIILLLRNLYAICIFILLKNLKICYFKYMIKIIIECSLSDKTKQFFYQIYIFDTSRAFIFIRYKIMRYSPWKKKMNLRTITIYSTYKIYGWA